jgi:hypothetical protein
MPGFAQSKPPAQFQMRGSRIATSTASCDASLEIRVFNVLRGEMSVGPGRRFRKFWPMVQRRRLMVSRA